MEEISNFNNKELSADDFERALKVVLENDMAREKRRELSENSFKEWVYNYLHTLLAKLGYALQSFEEFWIDVKDAIVSGWQEGVALAHEEAEHRRKMRERLRR